MSMFIRFWSTLGNVFFTLYCLYNIRTRIARAAPLFPRSTFGGSKRSILQFPNGGYRLMMRFFLRRWICSFWVVDFVFSDVFSPTLSMWHTQCSAGIIFTWFSLKFNDSYVLLVFKLLPHCKRVFLQKSFWTELNQRLTTTKALKPSRRCYCLFSFLSNESVRSGNAASIQSENSLQFIGKWTVIVRFSFVIFFVDVHCKLTGDRHCRMKLSRL